MPLLLWRTCSHVTCTPPYDLQFNDRSKPSKSFFGAFSFSGAPYYYYHSCGEYRPAVKVSTVTTSPKCDMATGMIWRRYTHSKGCKPVLYLLYKHPLRSCTGDRNPQQLGSPGGCCQRVSYMTNLHTPKPKSARACMRLSPAAWHTGLLHRFVPFGARQPGNWCKQQVVANINSSS